MKRKMLFVIVTLLLLAGPGFAQNIQPSAQPQ